MFSVSSYLNKVTPCHLSVSCLVLVFHPEDDSSPNVVLRYFSMTYGSVLSPLPPKHTPPFLLSIWFVLVTVWVWWSMIATPAGLLLIHLMYRSSFQGVTIPSTLSDVLQSSQKHLFTCHTIVVFLSLTEAHRTLQYEENRTSHTPSMST